VGVLCSFYIGEHIQLNEPISVSSFVNKYIEGSSFDDTAENRGNVRTIVSYYTDSDTVGYYTMKEYIDGLLVLEGCYL